MTTSPKFIEKFLCRFDGHTQELLRGASVAFVLKVFAAGLGFALNVVIARRLGADGAGLYFLSLILVTIVATLARVGTDGALVRFISAGDTEGDWGKIKGVYKHSLFLCFNFSLALSFCLFFAAPMISHHIFHKPGLEKILQLMSFAVLPFALYSLHAFALQGLKKIREANILVGILAPSFTLAGCALLIAQHGVVGAAIAYVLSSVLTLLMGILFWRAHTSKKNDVLAYFKFPLLLKSAFPLFNVAIFNLILMWNAPLLLGMLGSTSELAIFQVANRVAMLTSFILVAVNSIFAPKVSACFAQDDMQLAASLIKKTSGLMLLLATPFLLVLIVFPAEIMAVFGEEFRKGATLLIILAIAQFINVATGSVGQILIMSGNEAKLQRAFMITAMASLSVSYFFIQEFGALGAAFSTAFGVVTVNLLAAYFVFRYVKIGLFL